MKVEQVKHFVIKEGNSSIEVDNSRVHIVLHPNTTNAILNGYYESCHFSTGAIDLIMRLLEAAKKELES